MHAVAVHMPQEDPWREYKQVAQVYSETQKEFDERRFLQVRAASHLLNAGGCPMP